MLELEQEHIDYLNALRDSGVTNMFGAHPYLAERFEIDQRDAKRLLMQWMTHVAEEHANAHNS